ncbi:MAG TPA: hypothetical protein VFF20_00660 [Pseudogracilibacillus sp.]|nr:hypothetical protein [Pseudogracilibacillus sp.]
MLMILTVFLIILFIITMIMTWYAFKKQEDKIKAYEQGEHDFDGEYQRSIEYEKTSIKKYLPIQLWVYAITTILTLLFILYFVYKY